MPNINYIKEFGNIEKVFSSIYIGFSVKIRDISDLELNVDTLSKSNFLVRLGIGRVNAKSINWCVSDKTTPVMIFQIHLISPKVSFVFLLVKVKIY